VQLLLQALRRGERAREPTNLQFQCAQLLSKLIVQLAGDPAARLPERS
jgi:hypothetical protein